MRKDDSGWITALWAALGGGERQGEKRREGGARLGLALSRPHRRRPVLAAAPTCSACLGPRECITLHTNKAEEDGVKQYGTDARTSPWAWRRDCAALEPARACTPPFVIYDFDQKRALWVSIDQVLCAHK